MFCFFFVFKCFSVDIVVSSPTHSRTSSMSSGYGNSNSSLKNSPIIQSPSHSRQSSGVSLNELKLVNDTLDGIIDKLPKETQVSDEEKDNDFSGNLYYKTINGGVIRSVKPPNKNNGEVKYKVGKVWFLCRFDMFLCNKLFNLCSRFFTNFK